MRSRPNHYSALLLIVGLLFASCSGSDSDDASVVPTSTLENDDPVDDSESASRPERGDGPAITVNGTSLSHEEAADFISERVRPGEDSSDPAAMARLLSAFVVNALVDDELSSRNIEIDDNDLRNAAALLAQPGTEPSEVAIADFASQLVLAFALSDQEPIDEAAVQASYDAAPPVEACSSHILLENEDNAAAVLELLDDGADFAEMAVEHSTGPSGPTGGDLGCTDPSSFVPAFAEAVRTAELGEVVGPVETEFGFHLILVADRTETDFDEAAPGIRATALNEVLPTIGPVFSDYFAAQSLEVELDPFYGTWDPESRTIAAT